MGLATRESANHRSRFALVTSTFTADSDAGPAGDTSEKDDENRLISASASRPMSGCTSSRALAALSKRRMGSWIEEISRMTDPTDSSPTKRPESTTRMRWTLVSRAAR
jgi:hypothetical protein